MICPFRHGLASGGSPLRSGLFGYRCDIRHRLRSGVQGILLQCGLVGCGCAREGECQPHNSGAGEDQGSRAGIYVLAIAACESIDTSFRTVTNAVTCLMTVDTFDFDAFDGCSLLFAKSGDMAEFYCPKEISNSIEGMRKTDISGDNIPLQLPHFGTCLSIGKPASASLSRFASGLSGQRSFRFAR